jgi:hypothetical protein
MAQNKSRDTFSCNSLLIECLGVLLVGDQIKVVTPGRCGEEFLLEDISPSFEVVRMDEVGQE